MRAKIGIPFGVRLGLVLGLALGAGAGVAILRAATASTPVPTPVPTAAPTPVHTTVVVVVATPGGTPVYTNAFYLVQAGDQATSSSFGLLPGPTVVVVNTAVVPNVAAGLMDTPTIPKEIYGTSGGDASFTPAALTATSGSTPWWRAQPQLLELNAADVHAGSDAGQ